MKSAYLTAAMPAGVFMRLVLRNGITPRPPFLTRFLFVLQSGLFSSLLAPRERRINRDIDLDAVDAAPPVFIIGHWRSGTTLLHQLMARCPSLCAPSLYQTCYPHSFMTARRFVEPIMKPLVNGTRPMDNVALAMDEPQEEENALFRMTGLSPLEQLVFPRSGRYFLADNRTWLPSTPRQLDAWRRSLRWFVAKVHLQAGAKAVVLKNPFHSMRISCLRALFPGARFLFMERNPRDIVPSAVHMWSVVGAQNTFRRNWRAPSIEDVTTVFRTTCDRIDQARARISPERQTTVRFESLEAAPIRTLQAACEEIGLPFTVEFRRRVERFLADHAGYKKNAYALDPRQASYIEQELADIIGRQRY
jgi:hypothetical protein